MFLTGLLWQFAVASALITNFSTAIRDFLGTFVPELTWWSNVVLLIIVARLGLGRTPSILTALIPIAMALFAFGIRKFGIPDDDFMPVVAYGAGYWLWLASMLMPTAAWLVAWRRRQSRL